MGNISEMVPNDAPKALLNAVVLTQYIDASIYNYILKVRTISVILHFINQTPLYWYPKKQATSEIATYGAEFVTAYI